MKIYKIAQSQNVNWDPNGMGETPNSRNVDYLGFTKYMSPQEFLSLVPKGFSNKDTVPLAEQKIKNNEPICPPFLLTKWDEKNNQWITIDHEGRSRTQAALNIFGNNISIPVHIFPYGMRARNITEEMKNAKFIPQK